MTDYGQGRGFLWVTTSMTGTVSGSKSNFSSPAWTASTPTNCSRCCCITGIPRKDTNPLAHRLMDTFGSLSGVLEAEYEELCRVEGVTPHTAMLLCFCGKLFWRYYQDKYEDGVILTGTQDFGNYRCPGFSG